MTHTDSSVFSEHADDHRFIASLAPRLPRIAAITAFFVFGTFAAIQLLPQTYEARTTIGIPGGQTAEQVANQLLDQQNLGEMVARLSPDIIAEMRRDGGGVTDTTALLRQRLRVTPNTGDNHLALTAEASTPARARALVAAVTATVAMPPALSEIETKVSQAKPPQTNENTAETLQQKLSLAWEDRVKLETRARRIEALVADGNYTMLAMDADKLPGLGRQLDDLTQLETERDKLSVNLLPNHPNMRTLQEEIDSLQSDIAKGAQQLSALVTADRDAARRLEDSLRDQLAAATNIPAIDTSVTTGAIAGAAAPEVTALPRPVRTDLALGLAGGLAFFGQVGLFALFRPRPLVEAENDDLEVIEPELEAEIPATSAPQILPETAQPVAQNYNWLPPQPVETSPVAAHWLGEPAAPAPRPPEPPPAPVAYVRSGEAEVIAVTGMGDANLAARRLLARCSDEGRRVCIIDAASRRRGRVPGISDLSLGKASFADIVHGSANEAALVPWGQEEHLDAHARPVRILIQALAELYDVVIIALDSADPDTATPLAALADRSITADAVAPARRRAG